MKLCTGRIQLLEGAMIEAVRASMRGGFDQQIVVVPKQLTLQTERTLLKALDLRGSFALQVLSPERLCARIFDASGLPDGARIDERGRVMLVRAAIRDCADALRLYRGAEHRRGFPDRCARQLELIRQAGLTPERLRQSAGEAEGLLSMKMMDLAAIQQRYEALIEGRFQDGESEFNHAVERCGGAAFLQSAAVCFYGFDLMPPTLHRLIAAVGAICPECQVFLPLEDDETASDADVFLPIRQSRDRLLRACEAAGTPVEALRIAAPEDRSAELRHLARELFAFPARVWEAEPRRIQMAACRNPLEECRFAAALCRTLAMKNGWRWNDFMILCRDIEGYHQPLREAFQTYGVPVFLSSSRPAARHALSECVLSALRLIEGGARAEDALALIGSGFMPIDEDEADRLQNHIAKYAVRPAALLRPLRRGSEAELQALEPIRARFAAPLNTLKGRLKRAETLPDQLSAVFRFLEDAGVPARLQARLDRLAEAGLREAAGEEAQVWNRLVGALDQMAALMGDAPLPVSELRETLTESLEAAVIKNLPQSDDAVYAQTAERVVARPVKALLLLGETDRSGVDTDGLFNAPQLKAVSRLTGAYLGSDDDELSHMRRFYLKSALAMVSGYLCVSWPLSGLDNSAQHSGQLPAMLRGLFPKLAIRGGVTGDDALERMLLSSPEAAMAGVARALSARGEGIPLRDCDAAALAALSGLAGEREDLRRGFDRLRAALAHGESADKLNPDTARALYGEINRQSITRLERFAQCPFAYFTQYGLKPERIQPFVLSVQDEGTFFHDAVRAFLAGSKGDLNAIDIPTAQARMDVIADGLLDQMAEYGPLGDSAVALAERRRLKATARTCAGVLTEHMQGSRFVPADLETAFGREDGAARLVVDAASGACVLEGRIDRIDDWAEGGYLRVIDYKRGGKPLNLDAVYHGLSLQLPVYLAAAMKRRGELSAGVYYFNLDEGILTLQTTDPNAVEKQRRSAFRMTGLAVDDVDVLAAQSPSFPEVLNVRVGQNGALYKGTLATDQRGFDALTAHALSMAGEQLDAIREGRAEVAPASYKMNVPCAWCDWRAACLFDPRLDAACVRRFKPIRGDEVLEKLKAGDGERETGNRKEETGNR